MTEEKVVDSSPLALSAIAKFGLVLVSAILFVLFLLSLGQTYGFPSNGVELATKMAATEPLASIVASFALVCICPYILNRMNSIGPGRAVRLCCVFAFLTALVWAVLFQGYRPIYDQMELINGANMLAHGDSAGLRGQGYVQWYPYQSGYLLWDYIVGSLFGFSNWMAFRMLGVISAPTVVWALSRLVDEELGHPEASAATALLAVAFLPISLYSTFVYGNMPSLALSLLSLLFQTRAIDRRGNRPLAARWGLFSLMSLFAAIWLKPNSAIFVAAAEVVWVSMSLARKTISGAIMAAALALVCFLGSIAPIAVFSSMSGVSVGNGIPKTAWITMGLMETPGHGAGWYNAYISKFKPYVENGEEKEGEASALATSDLKERLRELAANPAQAVRVFSYKVLSQWVEPTFQAFWATYHGNSSPPWEGEWHLNPGIDYDSLLQRTLWFGKGHAVLLVYLDALQTLVYGLALIGMVMTLRAGTPIWRLSLPIAFLGGFLFHLVWEAKSCYTLSYFVLLIPFASIALVSICGQKKGGH